MMKRSRIVLLFLILTPLLFGQNNPLTLSEALERTLENNYGILISEKQSDIATVNNSWGAAGRLPSVTFTGSSLNSQDLINDSFSSRLNAGLGARWTIFEGFRVALTKDKLDQLEKLSEGRVHVVVENTIEDLILAYYQVLLQMERLDVLETVMTLSEDRYAYELNRKEIGNSVTYNVLQAKNNWLSDKSDYMNQEVTLRNSVRNLNYLMGEDPSLTWVFPDNLSVSMSDYNLEEMVDKMLSDNNNIRNQYINILLDRSEEKLSRSPYYPSLSLNTGVDNSNTLTGVSSSGLSGYANLSLTYNLYLGGSRKRAEEVARINRETSEIEDLQLKHSLTNQIFNMFDLYNVRKEIYSLSRENLEAAELNLQIADDKFKSGVINSFNYRDIQLIYLNVAFQEIQSIFNLISSETELTRITGGFVSNPEK